MNNTTECFIGIDVGKTGAMSIIQGDEVFHIDYDIKNGVKTYVRTIVSLQRIIGVGIELVHSMPKQGVASTFTFGTMFGELLGMLRTLEAMDKGVNYQLVSPKVWQNFLMKNSSSSNSKQDYADKLIKIYPSSQFYGSRGGLKSGRSDALAIAHYIKETYGKKSKDKRSSSKSSFKPKK